LESQLETPPLSPTGVSNLISSGAFLKHVQRTGVLQDRFGSSIAAEFGVPLPDTLGPSGTGFSVAGIVSQRWDLGTAHLNVQGPLTRTQNADAFTSFILEGPIEWKVSRSLSSPMKKSSARRTPFRPLSARSGRYAILLRSTPGDCLDHGVSNRTLANGATLSLCLRPPASIPSATCLPASPATHSWSP
jgi:hypothetical protein